MGQSIHQFTLRSIEGGSIPLASFKGKYIVLVNVASACGYTPQYLQLVELYNMFKEKLVVIGVPCNDFGGQEPGSAEEIQQFCSLNFNVTFPMSDKMKILGESRDEIFSFIAQKERNGYADITISWNFHKCVFDQEGLMIGCFPSGTDPLSDSILEALNIQL